MFAEGVALDEPKLALFAEQQRRGRVSTEYAPAEVHDMVVALSLS